MTKQMGYMGEAAAEPNKALVLTLAEICLRPADLLDTAIRRLKRLPADLNLRDSQNCMNERVFEH
jgi:hypothetical protein